MRCIIIRKSRILTIFNIIIALIVAVSLTITVIAVEKGSGSEVMPIAKIETKSKIIALTVNVYESTDTDAFLETLDENKATFFISEEFQESYPEKVKEIDKRGHLIGILIDCKGNISQNELYDILAVRIERMARITGKNTEFIRFKNEDYDIGTVKSVYSIGLLPIRYSENKGELSSGEIILVNDSKSAETLIKKTVAEGFTTATVGQLIKLQKDKT